MFVSLRSSRVQRYLMMVYNNLYFVAFLSACLTICGFVNARGVNGTTKKIQIEELTDDCLTCICDGISKCDPSFECERKMCGMFNLTKSYWYESGTPVMKGDTPDEKYAFPKCATYPPCARQTIINYMAKYAKDCNNDGVINCYDYAAIHKYGPNNCNRQFDRLFKFRFNSCQETVFALSGLTTPAE